MIKKSRHVFALHALILKNYHSHLELNVVNSVPKEKKTENLKRMLKNCVFYCWVVLVKKKKSSFKQQEMEMESYKNDTLDNKGDGNLMRKRRAIDQREVSPNSHSAPGAERSHQLLSSRSSWFALRCVIISRNQLPPVTDLPSVHNLPKFVALLPGIREYGHDLGHGLYLRQSSLKLSVTP